MLHEEGPTFISTSVLTFLTRFLPDTTMLSLEACRVDDAVHQVTLHVTSLHARVPCPRCHVQTARVHSRFTRIVADLPWGAYAVRLQLRVRKFFCGNAACPCQIFTERLPAVVAPWARRTMRLVERLRALGVALGGAGRHTPHTALRTPREPRHACCGWCAVCPCRPFHRLRPLGSMTGRTGSASAMAPASWT